MSKENAVLIIVTILGFGVVYATGFAHGMIHQSSIYEFPATTEAR